MRDRGWEFASLGETGTEETRDLLDQSVGCNEGIVLASKLLDQLLVLVQLLQVCEKISQSSFFDSDGRSC